MKEKRKRGKKMSVTNKVKALLAIHNKKNVELANYLKIAPQSLHNKFTRDSFSAEDLIKIAEFTDCKLIFEIDEKQKIIFDKEDIRKEERMD